MSNFEEGIDEDTDESHADEIDSMAHDQQELSADESLPRSPRWRSWMMLFVVLVIGLMMLGLFLATRPAPLPPPTLKPPWLV